ncbi:MAG TPA: M20 family metallopeptidase [Microthrixaceae bacterium]|nr:M20 family metallopeptidase [Microthrixaceae bacterium]
MSTQETAAPGDVDAVFAAVDRRTDLLVDVSHQIFEHPELCFEEHFAHDLLCDVLESEGLSVVRHAHGLDTAFVAEAGSAGPTVAVMCEYDALPGVGHACGHNVIAAAGLGAGLAAAEMAEQLGGRVRIVGTPAEEGGGGKVLLLRDGAFDGVDAAVMVHPADHDLPAMAAIAIQRLSVTYTGRASHAAAAPWDGANALDAAVLGYVNVAALRQHIRPDERVHGIFTDAGEQPNIVPRSAAASWYVRSPSVDGLAALKDRVLACLSAGAQAAGCEMAHEWLDPAYDDMVDDAWLSQRWAVHSASLGRVPQDPAVVGGVVGSTDMGNVSHAVASIHPMIAVAPPGVAIHTPEFARHARGPAGDAAVIDGAKALAAVVLDRWAIGN